jgi:hypothetical protein
MYFPPFQEVSMKKAAVLLAAVALMVAGQASATEGKKVRTPQQNRMKACAVQYHQKKIAKSQYRNFMKVCLRKTPANVAAKQIETSPSSSHLKVSVP